MRLSINLSKNLSKRINIKNAQASLEYLMIIGFVTVLTIPLLLIYHNQVQKSSQEIESRQILQVARKIRDAAEEVYFLGEPSQTEIDVFIPNNIESAELNGNEINFRFRGPGGISDIAQISSVNLTGSLPIAQGEYTITLKAEPDKVSISYS